VPLTGVSAVALNVTAASPTASGYLLVYPAQDVGRLGPSSNLNFDANRTNANLVITPVGGNGAVAIRNGTTGKTRIVVDVEGYVLAGTPTTPGAIEASTIRRSYDTGYYHEQPPGTDLVPPFTPGPPTESAVFLNVAGGFNGAEGYLSVHAYGTARPTTSSVNGAGTYTANLVLAKPASTGGIAIYNGTRHDMRIVVDREASTVPGTPTAAGTVRAVTPARIIDTAVGLGAPRLPLAGQHSLDVSVLGRGGIPTSAVPAVLLNVTAASPTASGYLTIYPSGTVRPTASNINFSTGATHAGLVIAPVGADGKVTIYSGSSGSLRLVVDVEGYVLGG
jgi:hypothetical protein